MFKGRKLVSGFLVGILAIGLVMNAGATNLQNAKDKKEEQRNQAETEKNSLAEKVRSLSASMKQTEEKLGAKKLEIEETEQELVMSKVEENKQYESMKLRIQYMYENGNVNYVELFLESDGIVEFLNKAEYIAKLSIDDKSVVTSGIYERFFLKNDIIFHHILDPVTGYPVKNNLSSVTIISDSSEVGDALSTAVFVMGLENGMKFINSYKDVEAIFVTNTNEIVMSNGLQESNSIIQSK